MFDLDRFIKAQEYEYETALNEMKQGEKVSHWIWYIFPQIKGLGFSPNSYYYGLDGKEEAKAYYENEYLGPRLKEICQVVLDIDKKSAEQIFGSIDAMKFKSSMTIFYLATGDNLFKKLLDKYYNSELDQATIKLLEK